MTQHHAGIFYYVNPTQSPHITLTQTLAGIMTTARMFAVYHSLHYKRIFTVFNVLTMSLGCWVLGALFSSTPFYAGRTFDSCLYIMIRVSELKLTVIQCGQSFKHNTNVALLTASPDIDISNINLGVSIGLTKKCPILWFKSR